MIERDIILKQLENFSQAVGKPVIVHSSLKAVGEINGGAEALLSVLIEFFTQKGGLLCIPTHTWKSMTLDLNKAESCIGVLPAVAAAHPRGIRSLHPTHSITVFGEKNRAREFVHEEAFVNTPTSPHGCYGNLYREDGFVLLIGVNHTKNTFLHCVEEMLGISGRLTEKQVEASIIRKDGTTEKRLLHWFDESIIPDVSLNFGKFEPAFRHFACITDGFIGDAPSQLCIAVKMKKTLELIYKNACGEELLADNSPLDKKLYMTGESINE